MLRDPEHLIPDQPDFINLHLTNEIQIILYNKGGGGEVGNMASYYTSKEEMYQVVDLKSNHTNQ